MVGVLTRQRRATPLDGFATEIGVDDVERTTTHEILKAMAILAGKAEEMPLASIAYQVAELIHDEEMTLPPAAAERLLHIGAALWCKSISLGEKL